jgi:sialate O-acetylesterase
MRILAVSLFSIFSIFNTDAQLSLSGIFSDHAVLQRDQPLPIWGWATKGQSVSVTFNGRSLSTKANSEGRWQVVFPEQNAGGPYTMIVQAGAEQLIINDLYLGEVWLCSGQSNMEWSMDEARPLTNADIRQAKQPLIRHFKVANEVALTPQTRLPKGSSERWAVCSPESVQRFTAVGYFFAQEVQRNIEPGIAIGLVNAAWGGSQLEGWFSPEGMLQTPALSEAAKTLPKDWTQADEQLRRRIAQRCLGTTQLPTAEQELNYPQLTDFSSWQPGYAPGSWDWQGIWAYRGRGYMARTITLPAELVGQASTLWLGENDQPFEVYINGQLVKKDRQEGVIRVELPANTWSAGANRLLLHIGWHQNPDWRGVGLHGSGDQVRLDIGEETVDLSDDRWHLMPAWAQQHQFLHLNNNVATSLYNGIIHPLVPMAIRGVLWYQGETNAGRAWQYRETFPALIQDWRRIWGEELPFLFVQLSAYGRNESANAGSLWAELREAQTLALQLPNTGMAVTTDVGDPDDIHPKNKKDVGKRLAYHALAQVYNRPVPHQSPVLNRVIWEAGSAVLIFDHTEQGLMAKDKFGYVRGFEVAAEDRKFHYAPAEIVNGNQVVIRHPEGLKPEAVRYAWSDAPTDANVYNAAGLPLGTFRTDDWEARTLKVRFEH